VVALLASQAVDRWRQPTGVVPDDVLAKSLFHPVDLDPSPGRGGIGDSRARECRATGQADMQVDLVDGMAIDPPKSKRKDVARDGDRLDEARGAVRCRPPDPWRCFPTKDRELIGRRWNSHSVRWLRGGIELTVLAIVVVCLWSLVFQPSLLQVIVLLCGFLVIPLALGLIVVAASEVWDSAVREIKIGEERPRNSP